MHGKYVEQWLHGRSIVSPLSQTHCSSEFAESDNLIQRGCKILTPLQIDRSIAVGIPA